MSTDANGKVSGTITGVTDTNGDALSYSVPARSSGGGAVTVNATTGGFTYTPTAEQRIAASAVNAPSSATRDAFTVTAADGHGGAATVSVGVTIKSLTTPVGDYPTDAQTEFHVVQEYFHDGGGKATDELTDLLFDAASFKAVLTSSENSLVAAHRPFFAYFAIPQELVRSAVLPSYPQTLDASYAATMAGLVSSYGIENMYLFAMPEWDNDPANNSWAQNRFSEAGVGGSRPDLPTGLSRQQAYDQWMHFYLASNHDGNTNHHQLGQILSVPYQTRGYKTKANSVNAGSAFYAYDMGVDFVTLQRVNDDISGLVGGIALIPRGGGAVRTTLGHRHFRLAQRMG